MQVYARPSQAFVAGSRAPWNPARLHHTPAQCEGLTSGVFCLANGVPRPCLRPL